MEKDTLYKVIYWSLFACAIGALWISLRTQYNQIEYSLVAAAFWGAAYLFNKKFLTKS